MHAYATDSEERTELLVVMALIAIGLAMLTHKVLHHFDWQAPWWFDAPSVGGYYGLILKWFDNYGWRLSVVRSLGLVRVPDLAGVWAGGVQSSHGGAEVAVSVRIRQRWMKCVVTMETSTSRSKSLTAMVCLDDDPEPTLTYDFINEPKPGAPSTMNMHRGTTILRYMPDALGRLEGDYYSGRGRQNTGAMLLQRTERTR